MSVGMERGVQPERARIYRIFSQAVELEGSPRDTFLERECGADPFIRAEVDVLLLALGREQALTGALLPQAPRREEELTGRTFGRFRLAERIGEGGMGVVYRAERTDGVPQTVAIKLISNTVGLGGQRRFAREGQLLARLEHPAVARLIDAGVDTERAWIAMEYVRGTRIDQYCAARKLSPAAIVTLIAQLADAIAAAHRLLVVHSDIKPTNVLVTADGVPKLIDFGISTVLRDAGTEDGATADAGRLFSPGFAAPEQINGGPVTVATDVYGLGALAYRLLTGAPIYRAALTPLDYMREIARHDVEPPSRAALAAGSSAPEARALRGDLDAILAKALERDPARRYASAADLQADLRRYLSQRPVSARSPSPDYRLVRFAQRNRLAVALAGLLLAGAIGGGIFMGWQARSTTQAREIAARRDEFLEALLKSADPNTGRRNITVAELLDSAAARLDGKLSAEPLAEASMLGLLAQTNLGLGRYSEGLAANDRQLAILRQHGGADLEFGRALSTRGELLRAQGKWSESEAVAREAVMRLGRLNAPAELCSALDTLGVALAHMHREAEAETIYHEDRVSRESGAAQSQDDSVLRPHCFIGRPAGKVCGGGRIRTRCVGFGEADAAGGQSRSVGHRRQLCSVTHQHSPGSGGRAPDPRRGRAAAPRAGSRSPRHFGESGDARGRPDRAASRCRGRGSRPGGRSPARPAAR